MIDTFIGLGGQGIEVISGNQPRDITTKFANLADEKGLFASIGSDFHRQHPHATNVGALGKLPSIAKPIWHYF